MKSLTLFVLAIFAIAVGVFGREATKESLVNEAAELKKLIQEALHKLEQNGRGEEGDQLKRFERDVSVVEKHIEQAGNDSIATKSASIVLGGLTKKIHDEIHRCEALAHH